MGSPGGWIFTLDEDDLVIPEGPASFSENARLAMETMIIPFGSREAAVVGYLREWRRMWDEFGVGYTLSTATAGVRTLSGEAVRIEDMYGQFDDCEISVVEFESILLALAGYLGGLSSS